MDAGKVCTDILSIHSSQFWVTFPVQSFLSFFAPFVCEQNPTRLKNNPISAMLAIYLYQDLRIPWCELMCWLQRRGEITHPITSTAFSWTIFLFEKRNLYFWERLGSIQRVSVTFNDSDRADCSSVAQNPWVISILCRKASVKLESVKNSFVLKICKERSHLSTVSHQT